MKPRAQQAIKYQEAAGKLSAYLTRIQVQSSKHKDLDGAWFRAFDYGRWDYWASIQMRAGAPGVR